MMPRPFVQARIGRCTHSCGYLQYAIESHHRPEPAVESEHEFVEIALQVLWTDPMMCSQEPRIEIPEDDVNHWEVLIQLYVIPLDSYGIVSVVQFL